MDASATAALAMHHQAGVKRRCAPLQGAAVSGQHALTGVSGNMDSAETYQSGKERYARVTPLLLLLAPWPLLGPEPTRSLP